jgi:hypothetical protein
MIRLRTALASTSTSSPRTAAGARRSRPETGCLSMSCLRGATLISWAQDNNAGVAAEPRQVSETRLWVASQSSPRHPPSRSSWCRGRGRPGNLWQSEVTKFDRRASRPSIAWGPSQHEWRSDPRRQNDLRYAYGSIPSRRGEGVPYTDATRQFDLSIDRPRMWLIPNNGQAQTAAVEWPSKDEHERDHVHRTWELASRRT